MHEATKHETKQANRKLIEARRRWGRARVLTGNPIPKPNHPAPSAPAAAANARRAA